MKLPNYVIGALLLVTGYIAGQLDLGMPSMAVQTAQAEADSRVEDSADLSEEMSAPAYMVVTGKDYDPETMVPYVKAIGPLYKKFGGSYIAVSRDFVALEGEHDYQSILISKWPSLEKAEQFWWSPEYEEIKKMRENNGVFNAVAFEGFTQARKAPPLVDNK